ncbi:MAG: tetratricopeptide repeat protein, partial [Gemmatimonadetes bacterium]|nr:tetratricopeptide repeat protein [Gemmatimonadota bacterium]
MRRNLVLIFIVALGGYELSAQSTGEARAAYMAGEYEEAINIYLDVLDEDATTAPARIGLIPALLAPGQYEEAVHV